MDLLLQLQSDVAAKINSEASFDTRACVTYREWVTSQEIARREPHLLGATVGEVVYTGLGILVMMPVDRGILPNIAPPMSEDHVTLWVVENPEINIGPAQGTQITAEQTARDLRRLLHQFGIEGLTMLYQEDMAITPIPGIEKLWPGCLGYQVALKGRVPDTQVPKCVNPVESDDGAGNVTLTTTDEGATIIYTLDGNFPGSDNVAPFGSGSAQVYAGTFNVPNGTVIRWASYLAGYYGSNACQGTVNYS